MEPFVALTLQLRPGAAGLHRLAMHLRFPAKQLDAQLLATDELLVQLPPDELPDPRVGPGDYGRLLAGRLFAHERARSALATARSLADAEGLPLHLGLDLSGCVPEVQALSWELLGDPEPGRAALALSGRVLLSRTLASADLRPVARRERPARRALVAVAAPDDLSAYGFSPLPAEAELARAAAALAPLEVARLAGAAGRPCTLAGLRAALGEGPDLVCLVAHGRRVDDEIYLWLDDDAGHSRRVASSALADCFESLAPSARPALVILATCESGVAAAGAPALTVGPLLAGQGASAVLAVQGLLSLDTNAVFLPTLLREVLRDGLIDRAVAAARYQVRDRPDWWAPLLWLRPPDGRLWQGQPAPGASAPPVDAPAWSAQGTWVAPAGDEAARSFIAYGPESEAFAESLARRLRAEPGLGFWFAPWHSVPGEDRQRELEAAIEAASSCAVLIGPGGLADWQNEALRLAIQKRVEDDRRHRVIPVLLPGVPRAALRTLPPLLRRYQEVAFHSPDDGAAYTRLLAGIYGVSPAELEGRG